MKSFEEYIKENTVGNGTWTTINGAFYQIEVTQYSNKGPLFIIKNQQGQDVGRAYFDLVGGNKWKISEV